MKNIITLSFLFMTLVLSAQNMTIKGTIKDTTANQVVRGAVAMAIRVKDSVLLDFQRTDKMGQFSLTLPIDTIELVIRHPEYGDFKSYFFGSKQNNEFNLDPLVMPSISTSLSEFVIYANKNPIYYRGDTLVYVADSFKVKENAVVEDLLKKLPGMKVDANGKITNQGKEINQVLVDGDEFFGNDPTIATKNLAAKGVETVQVYEKDSEDGSDEKIQVLDLKLKEEAKKGYFGKINVAGGLDKFVPSNFGFYENDLLLNRYNSRQKIAVFALASNTPKSNFNGRDMFKFGLSEGRMWGNETDDLETQGGSGGGINTSGGIPQTLRAGFYIDQKLWKGGSVRLNYAYSDNKIVTKSSTLSQYILTDTTYKTDASTTQNSRYQQHQIGVKFIQQIDSLTKVELEPKFTINKTTDKVVSGTGFISEDSTLVRSTQRTSTTTSDGLGVNTTFRLTRDFKKKNRKLIARYNLAYNDNSSNNDLNTDDDQFSFLRFDQKKENLNNSLAQTAYANYVEPLSKKWKAEFDYEYYSNENDQSKTTFSKDAVTGLFDVRDSIYSNAFSTSRKQNRAGAFLVFENNKVRVSVGSRVRDISIDNINLVTDTNIAQGLTNVLPRAIVQFKFSQSSRLRIQYNTNSSLPSVDQLQPVRDNSNPNFIQKGNQDLKPNYTHTVNANYNMWRGLSGFYVYSGLNYVRQNNAFSTSTNYVTNGTSESMAINVDHADYLYFWGGTGIPFKKVKDLRLDINLNGNVTSTQNVVNSQKNFTKNTGIGTDLDLNYNGDSLNLSLGAGIEYNVPSSTLNSASNQPYTNYDFSVDVNWTLPGQFFINSDATYNVNSGRTAGYNINYVIWNASIQRSFLKTQNLLFGIEAYDILNQNISNSRTVNANVIVDQKSNIIKRYFMAKMTLKFNNNHTKEAENEGWF